MTDDMKLPDGKTCSDCAHWRRCKALIDDLRGDERWCDFGPSRFRLRSDASGGNQQPSDSAVDPHVPRTVDGPRASSSEALSSLGLVHPKQEAADETDRHERRYAKLQSDAIAALEQREAALSLAQQEIAAYKLAQRQWSDPTPELQALRETNAELIKAQQRLASLEAGIGEIGKEMREAVGSSAAVLDICLVEWADALSGLCSPQKDEQHTTTKS